MTGPALGRPKSATFRTFDIVGLDVLAHVAKNIHEAVPEDEERAAYALPDFVTRMVERRLLGEKTGGGFYQKRKGEDGRRDIWTLDVASLDYRPRGGGELPALDGATNIEDARAPVKGLP